MRIIGGRLRRRTLHAPRGHVTRPTTDRTRESLFGLIESRMSLDGTDVLDLFAGTGSLGLEAVSRGAHAVTFVEKEGHVLKYARRNAAELGVEDHCVFFRADAVRYLERYHGPPFDLILADPPYDLPALPRLPDLALRSLKPGRLFVLEHDRRHRFDDHPALETTRTYGRTLVSVFREEEADEAEPEARGENAENVADA